MPYINNESRQWLKPLIDAIQADSIRSAGELNYVVTEVILSYINKPNSLSYQRINDVVGALESVKSEFQRRVVAPYEDLKIKENGDVY